ncbi:MAG TPA: hypothetical protein VG345_02625 [Bryobacteraceae bacterium]|nr:hypothetical protein [Bryobacteraceae bacterium]
MQSSVTRRMALRLTFGAGVIFSPVTVALAAADFWNKKQPSEWSGSEIQHLMSKSPWAKEVNAGVLPQPNGPNAGPGPDTSPGGLGGGRGMGGPGGGGYNIGSGREQRDRGARPAAAVTVRWESAQPMLDATRETLPAEFANHYVIAVAGLPIEWGLDRAARAHRSDAEKSVHLSDLVERLKAGATLQARDREPEGAGVVRRAPSDEAWLFGFSRELLPLTASDKDVEFALNSGPMAVKAKFEPKEMMYRGRLAL